jgi:hypothetical protein
MPGRVSSAAVVEAGDMDDRDLIRPESVAVRAAGRWVESLTHLCARRRHVRGFAISGFARHQ